jgi:hypothetical protein
VGVGLVGVGEFATGVVSEGEGLAVVEGLELEVAGGVVVAGVWLLHPPANKTTRTRINAEIIKTFFNIPNSFLINHIYKLGVIRLRCKIYCCALITSFSL